MTQNGPKNFLVAEGVDVLLGDGEREERGVLRLGFEGCLQTGAFGRICKCRLGCLRGSFKGVLGLDVLRVGGLGRVQEVDTQLLFATGATFEVERFRLVELTHHAGKHAMECNLCHFALAILVDVPKLRFSRDYSDALALRSAKLRFTSRVPEDAPQPAQGGKGLIDL